LGEGIVMIQKFGEDNFRYFSKNLMDAVTGDSIPLPEPNTFSFNSPKGSCPTCKGLGNIKKINTDFFVENPKLSINQVLYYRLKILRTINGCLLRSNLF
jgi:excinuclease ABC subunit A